MTTPLWHSRGRLPHQERRDQRIVPDRGPAEKDSLLCVQSVKKFRESAVPFAVSLRLVFRLPARSSPHFEAAGYLFRRHVLDAGCDLPGIALRIFDHGAPIAIVHVRGLCE